jgi:hypothetical protein
VLIEKGGYHEAERLLKGVPRAMGADQVVDLRDAFAGLRALRRGRQEAAEDLVRELESRGARGVELDRLRRELGVSPMAEGSSAADPGCS